MTISGYQTIDQVRGQVRALHEERHGYEAKADEEGVAAVDQQLTICEAELARMTNEAAKRMQAEEDR